jgi:hypothetical protein
MFIGIAVGIPLVILTILVHYEILRITPNMLPRLAMRPRQRIIVVILAAFLAHIIEIWLYAGAYYALHRAELGSFGSLGGTFSGHIVEYVYFSAVSYTSLGLGDVWPSGVLRLITGLEALNGLILIAWSASFTYLSMEKFWEDHPAPRSSPSLGG